jgi:hypothetical protein
MGSGSLFVVEEVRTRYEMELACSFVSLPLLRSF